MLSRVYNDLKKCCHPEWSYHPRRKQGFQLLTEALDTLSNKDGKREEYVRQFVREVRATAMRGERGFAAGRKERGHFVHGGARACVRRGHHERLHRVLQAREKERLLKDLQRGVLREEAATAVVDPAAEADDLRKQVRTLILVRIQLALPDMQAQLLPHPQTQAYTAQ